MKTVIFIALLALIPFIAHAQAPTPAPVQSLEVVLAQLLVVQDQRDSWKGEAGRCVAENAELAIAFRKIQATNKNLVDEADKAKNNNKAAAKAPGKP